MRGNETLKEERGRKEKGERRSKREATKVERDERKK